MHKSKHEFIEKWVGSGFPIVPVNILSKKLTVDLDGWLADYSKENVIQHFTVHPTDVPKHVVPEGVVGLGATAPQFDKTFRYFVEDLGIPNLWTLDKRYFFRCSNPSALNETVPEGIGTMLPGDIVHSELVCREGSFQSIADLNEINPPVAPPKEVKTPLQGMSLLGQASAFEARALDCKSLLGNVATIGQSTIWYAAPNAGKTLLALSLLTAAITRKAVLGRNCYYINADDNAHGIAEKLRLLDEYEVHTLVPGERGFNISDLLELLEIMANDDQCRGVVVILDTVKKAVDLMDKGKTTRLGVAIRRFTQKGGTFLGLAHTRKNPGTTGKAVYGGTTDLVEDCDAVFMLSAPVLDASKGLKVVQFEPLKLRGAGANEAYGYASEATSYQDLIASVVLVDHGDVRELQELADRDDDEPIVAGIIACIEQGICSKMQLTAAVAERVRVSRRAALAVLERYEGSAGNWEYSVKARGAKVYSLLPSD